MSEPWMKFYPRDWRGDQALRAVSIAARGFWMECLCIMHEAKPYGHLVLNGAPVDGGTLARMTGVSVDEVSELLSELRQAGVLSVTSRGVVFSRRMTKDHARSQKGKKAAEKRWSQVPDGVEQSGAPNGVPNGTPITQKPEARSQISSSLRSDDSARREKPGIVLQAVLDPLTARNFADHLGRKLTPQMANGLVETLREVQRLGGNPVDAVNLAMRRGWASLDIEYLRNAGFKFATAPPPQQAEDWAGRSLVWSRDGTWAPGWGPKPGEPGCRMPKQLNREAAA